MRPTHYIPVAFLLGAKGLGLVAGVAMLAGARELALTHIILAACSLFLCGVTALATEETEE